jgi:mRNA-degrading endonuclease HigB of HigAB toxin-antitoxin module
LKESSTLCRIIGNSFTHKQTDCAALIFPQRHCSIRGFHEPLEVKSALPIDLGEFTEDHKVYEMSFENEYTGVIHYKQYTLKKKFVCRKCQRLGSTSIERDTLRFNGCM